MEEGCTSCTDLPWTVEKLRALPPFEFENWAVITLGGIPNKAQVGDMGIDGRKPPKPVFDPFRAVFGLPASVPGGQPIIRPAESVVRSLAGMVHSGKSLVRSLEWVVRSWE